MAYQALGLGSTANDGTGDDLRTGGDKINDNFVELYTALGTGSALTSGISADATTVTLTAPVIATSLDMNGGELFLDADADTSITADTDDTIHVKIAGNDRITLSTGLIDLKNDGAQSAIRMYCESSNAHYAALTAPAHADFSGNITITLPSVTDTLVGRTTTDTLTNKTLTAPTIASITNGGTVTIPSGADTLVARTSTDTLTNKTLTSPTITGTGAIAGVFTGNITGNVTGNVDGIVGGTTPAAGSFTTASTSVHFQAAVHADTTARDAAITSPAAGMVAYLTATNKLQVYTGSAWETITSS